MANFTKQAIKAAFLELLDEKPLNKISVRDIVERCGINRNSFYYHFQDIPSLLGEIIVERTNELMAQYPTVDKIEEAFRASIDYAQKNRRAIMHVYNSVSRDTFEASVMRLCAYMTEQYLKSAYPDAEISDTDREVLHRLDARRHEAGHGRKDGADSGALSRRCGADSGELPRVERLKLLQLPSFQTNRAGCLSFRHPVFSAHGRKKKPPVKSKANNRLCALARERGVSICVLSFR